MLAELHVQSLALVEDVWLEFAPGLTVLTGETGAGKTVLVSALKLLLGDRADAGAVRQGADEAVVEGRFVIDGADVVVRRRVSAEGRSRCTIDGAMATVTMLGELLGPHVDLHGQHEHQALLTPARHAGYLDRFIGPEASSALERYRAAFSTLAEARARLATLESALSDRDRRAEYLRFQIADIDRVAPLPGEVEEIESRLPRLRHGERLATAARTAWSALREDAGASERLSDAIAALRATTGLDPALDAIAGQVERLDVELQEAAGSLREYAESVDYDPSALDQAEGRLHQLGDLTRRYGPSLDDVIALRDSAQAELAALDAGEAGLERSRGDVTAALAAVRDAAEALRTVRRRAVPAFITALAGAAADLALPDAAFSVEIVPLPEGGWTTEGPDRVEFLFASSAGEAPRPLARIASGGEVSRVMLALKGVLGAADSVPVLVFDEVDAGIGGATARAVGRRLADLASGHQVLVVTHLPQVAAFADAHVVVSKSPSADRTVTTARHVVAQERIDEVARMLAGSVTPASLAHARELLDEAADRVRADAAPVKG